MIKLKEILSELNYETVTRVNEDPDGFVYGDVETDIWSGDSHVKAVYSLYERDSKTYFLCYLRERNRIVTNDPLYEDKANEKFYYSITTHNDLVGTITGLPYEEYKDSHKRLIHCRLFNVNNRYIVSFWEKTKEIKSFKNELDNMFDETGYHLKECLFEPADHWGKFFTYDQIFNESIKSSPTTSDAARAFQEKLHLDPEFKRKMLAMTPNRLKVAADKLGMPEIKLRQLLGKDVSESMLDETMTYNDLMKTVDTGRKERSRQVRSRSIPVSVDEDQESWNFRYKANPSTTGEAFQGKITFFKEVKNGQDVSNLPCKVDCECPDFRYRFAYNDAEKDAADIGNDTLNRCINQKPKPAYDYGVGMCKHLTGLSSYLNTRIKSTKKSNLFEAMRDVAQQKNFTFPCDE